jgi:hypothetical protein
MNELLLVAIAELSRIPEEESPRRGRDVAIDTFGRGDGDHVGRGGRQRFDVIELELVSFSVNFSHEIPGVLKRSARFWGHPIARPSAGAAPTCELDTRTVAQGYNIV